MKAEVRAVGFGTPPRQGALLPTSVPRSSSYFMPYFLYCQQKVSASFFLSVEFHLFQNLFNLVARPPLVPFYISNYPSTLSLFQHSYLIIYEN